MNITNFSEICEPFGDIIPIPYCIGNITEFSIGEFCPLIYFCDNNIKSLAFANIDEAIDYFDIISEDSSSFVKYLRILLNTVRRKALGIPPQSAEIPASFQIDKQLHPKGATLWIDRTIDEIKIADIAGRPVGESEAAIARLKLLAWAKELAENATSPIFSHFLKTLRHAERSGLYVEDILSCALLRRLSENIPRASNVANLIQDFRTRYNRGPLESVISLSRAPASPFANRASEVLDAYYVYVYELLKEGIEGPIKAQSVILAMGAADNIEQWPEYMRFEIDNIKIQMNRQISKMLKDFDKEFFSKKKKSTEIRSKQGVKKSEYPDRAFYVFKEIMNHIVALDHIIKATGTASRIDNNDSFFRIDFSNMGISEEYFVRHYENFMFPS